MWKETGIGDILPWDEIEDEAERLFESSRTNRQASDDNHADKEQEDDQIVDRDETDPCNEVIFGRRRPDSVAVDWTSKVLYVLEFKRTSDQRQDYREHRESRARAQHDILVKSLETVAGERVCVCCLLVLNLVSCTPPCIRQPGPRIRVLVLVCDLV